MSETIKTILLFLFVNSSSFMIQAQEKPSILLGNHTFSASKNEIGPIFLQGKLLKRAELSGNDARAFVIKRGQLSIRPEYNIAGAEYTITIADRSKNALATDTFKIIHDQFIKNKVVAHRGAWKKAGTAENSIAALNNAIRLGCGASEFDVHMSADSVLVINHDPSVQGRPIETTDSKELLTIKLANGETLPALSEFLKQGTNQNKTKLVLEIKPSSISKERGIATARRVVQLVRAMQAQAWIDYISFDYDICKELVTLDPYARVAYLNGDKDPNELKKDNMWGYDYHFSVLKKHESWLSEAQKLGLKTNAWTVNDRDTMVWLLNRGIDFITTNEPELLLEILKNVE